MSDRPIHFTAGTGSSGSEDAFSLDVLDRVNQGESVSAARRKAVRVRGAAPYWKSVRLEERLKMVRRFRQAMANDPWTFMGRWAPTDPLARHEWLVAQVAPLVEACRFLERFAVPILSGRPLGPRWGNWSWLSVQGRVLREPWGTVLILAPSNYPLYLPGVQVLQALVAGNTVLWKPAPGDDQVAHGLRQCFIESGLPPEVLRVLPSPVSSFHEALVAGIDRVILTGSAETGRNVLRALAEKGVPATMELSGVDGCLVSEPDSIDSAARAVAFAVHLNGGQTCMAPRRIWLPLGCTGRFVGAFQQAWKERGEMVRMTPLSPTIVQLLRKAQDDGAQLIQGCPDGSAHGGPWILTRAVPSMELLQSHWFAPLLCIGEYESDDQGILAMNSSPYALAASIFGKDGISTQRLAGRVQAGLVVINDIVAPSAHAHVTFGGAGASGYGSTRGPEGLLEMTRPKCVLKQTMSSPPHHEAPREGDTELLTAWLALTQGSGLRRRLLALRQLLSCAQRRAKARLLHRQPIQENPARVSSNLQR